MTGSVIGIIFGASNILPQTIGIFIAPLSHEFGWSRSEITFAQFVAVHVLVLLSPVAGYLADRFSIRLLATLSAALMGISLSSLAFFGMTLPIFYTIYGVSAAVGCCTTPVTFATLVSRWFDRRRGLALGLTLAGVGVGVTLLPVVGTAFIGHYGWRSAYLLLGCGALFISTPVMALLLKDRDVRMGADNIDMAGPKDAVAESHHNTGKAIDMSLASALRTSIFWRLLVVFMALGAAFAAVIVHLIPLLIDKGKSASDAAAIFAIVGVSSSFGRPATGYLLDRFAPAKLAAAILIPGALVIASFSMNLPGWAIALSAVIFGFANGSEVDILSYMIGRLFGLSSFGRIYGILFGSFTLGGAWGVLLLARLFDLTGSYKGGLIIMAGLVIGGTMLLFGVRLKAITTSGVPALDPFPGKAPGASAGGRARHQKGWMAAAINP